MEKTAKQVLAILREKRTYTYQHVLYMKNIPMPVDVKTARFLKNLGLFSFEK